MNETLVKLRLNGNKIKNKGGMAIAGALQVNTMLEELDLGETDQVMYHSCVNRTVFVYAGVFNLVISINLAKIYLIILANKLLVAMPFRNC